MQSYLKKSLIAFCFAFSTAAVYAADEIQITATGASTIAPLMAEIGKSFEKANPNVRIEVQSGGTSRGIADVRQGSARIGMVSRELHPDEKDLESQLIAYDGVGMIVHQSNPVKALSREQIIAIYTGVIKNWKEVGGADLPITVINKANKLSVFFNSFCTKCAITSVSVSDVNT